MAQEPKEQSPRGIMVPRRLPGCGPHLAQTEVCEVWFWDGDLARVQTHVRGEEERWLVEKGVMRQEDGWHDGAKDLLVGDVVYRIRTVAGLEMGPDPREGLFDWSSVNALTGVEMARRPEAGEWLAPEGVEAPPPVPKKLRGIHGVVFMTEWKESGHPVRLYGAPDGRRWEYRPEAPREPGDEAVQEAAP